VANSAAFESSLVWIFGSPRSGTTWLLNMLAEHDGVVPVDEPLIAWYLGPFVSDLPGADATLLDSSTFTMRRVQAAKEHQFFAEEYAAAWVPALARMMRERFYAQADRRRASNGDLPRSVVIKEPSGSQSADLISRALPRSRILFLLRDGRDVVDSELAASLEGGWVSREFPGFRGLRDGDRLAFVAQSAMKWLWRTEVVQAAVANHPGPTLTVRYEELRQEPEPTVLRIVSWLGLDSTGPQSAAAVERHRFERMRETGPSEFVRIASPGSWRENLRPDEQAVLEELLAPKLRELGYAT
jgi:Sulfotransferase family